VTEDAQRYRCSCGQKLTVEWTTCGWETFPVFATPDGAGANNCPGCGGRLVYYDEQVER
jgi:DNA-directed RNA polymerase subunit RPC12/RpoP